MIVRTSLIERNELRLVPFSLKKNPLYSATLNSRLEKITNRSFAEIQTHFVQTVNF